MGSSGVNGDVFTGMQLGFQFPAECLVWGGFPGNLLIPRPGAEPAGGVGGSLEEEGKVWGNPEGGGVSIANQEQIHQQQQLRKTGWGWRCPTEMGPAGAGQGMGCTILAGGCGDGVRCTKLPVLEKKNSGKGRKIGIAACSADQCL